MLGAGYLTLRPVPATAAGGPGGPAATTLTAVAARTASAIRGVALAYAVVQVIIWHAFYAADRGGWPGPRWRRPAWSSCWPPCGGTGPDRGWPSPTRLSR